MNPLIFREYDVRGVADRDLTDELGHRPGSQLRHVPEASQPEAHHRSAATAA